MWLKNSYFALITYSASLQRIRARIGLEKVNGEHSLIMLVYNIKRTINILGVPDLIAKIKNWKSPYKTKVLFLLKTDYLTLKSDFVFYQTKCAA